MARLPELPARRVLGALERAGFREARRRGSHRFLVHDDGRSLLFAVHERERIGPRLLTKILKDARVSPDEFRRQAIQAIPFKRMVEASEVADLAVYLASSAAGGITGQALNICGGATAGAGG